MSHARRPSRAERRKRTDPARVTPERRKGPPTEVAVYSQVTGRELQIFLHDPLTAENSGHARECFQHHLRRSPLADVVVDLERCAFIDTPGLSLLFDVKQTLAAQGRSLLLQNPSRVVLRMLNITRMTRIFPVRITNTDNQPIPVTRNP